MNYSSIKEIRTSRKLTVEQKAERANRKVQAKVNAERMKKVFAENAQIWSKGTCPTCGAKLVRNLSLTGWIQCKQLGAEGFREDSTKPSCNYQFFLCK